MSLKVILCLLPIVLSKFSPPFRGFLEQKYGEKMRERLERSDVGGDLGAFGGGTLPEKRAATHRPILFVHGIRANASSLLYHRRYFKSRDYTNAELFATSYGRGLEEDLMDMPVQCDYAKQIRHMIKAMHAYTRQRVDILAYSMGSVVARQAILGGLCVDTGENLGKPLTSLVYTFVSVAGANDGASLCVFPMPGTCDEVNGLYCHSQLIHNINNQSHYEGQYVYGIRSPFDELVGNACGKQGRIDMADGDFVAKMTHTELVIKTTELQYKLVTAH